MMYRQMMEGQTEAITISMLLFFNKSVDYYSSEQKSMF